MFHIPDEKRRMRDEIARLRHEHQVMAGVLESERQWRLNSLPELLAAEVRANKAERRIAELEAENAEFKDEIGTANRAVALVCRQNRELEAENAKLREPAYRLPWLPSEGRES